MSVLALNDIALIWMGWIVATFIHLAWGNWILRVVTKEDTPFFTFRSFWVGFVALIGFLQLWHFFLPITFIPLLVVTLIAMFLVFLSKPRLWEQGAGFTLHPVMVIFALLLFLIPEYALRPFQNFDNGLYHLQTIQWTSAYSIVPGLGNLHGRLAFNQSYFLVLTLFDFSWIGLYGSAIINGLLMMTLTLEGLGYWSRLITSRRLDPPTVLAIGLLGPLIYITFTTLWHYPGSPNADYVAMLVSFKLGIELMRLLTGTTPTLTDYFVVVLLAISHPIFKLSGAVFGLLALIVAIFWLWHRHILSLRRMAIIGIVVGSFLILPWVIRSAILSGYPVYPSTIGALPVDWRIPEAWVIEDANLIRSWARHPSADLHWSEVLKDWAWLDGWWESFWDLQGIRLGVWVSIGAWSVTGLLLLLRRRFAGSFGMVIGWTAIVVVQLLFWFYSAPSPRFGLAYIWLFAAGGIVALVEIMPFLKARLSEWLAYQSVTALFIMALVGVVLVSHGPVYFDTFTPFEEVGTAEFQTDSGLILYGPNDGALCWDSPLPCTPFPRPELRLRKAGDMGSGFTVQPE